MSATHDRTKVKGRGHDGPGDMDMDDREEGRGGVFESIPQTKSSGSAAMCESRQCLDFCHI